MSSDCFGYPFSWINAVIVAFKCEAVHCVALFIPGKEGRQLLSLMLNRLHSRNYNEHLWPDLKSVTVFSLTSAAFQLVPKCFCSVWIPTFQWLQDFKMETNLGSWIFIPLGFLLSLSSWFCAFYVTLHWSMFFYFAHFYHDFWLFSLYNWLRR